MTVQKSSSPSVHFGQFDQIVQFRNYLSNLSKVDEVNSPESVSEWHRGRGAHYRRFSDESIDHLDDYLYDWQQEENKHGHKKK